MAIWSLLTIPLLTIVTQLGYPALPFAYAINACAEAIILPYEYVPYLIIFSFGMMKVKDFFVFNLIRSIVVMVGICVVMTGYLALDWPDVKINPTRRREACCLSFSWMIILCIG